MIVTTVTPKSDRANERGAALVTMLLVTLLLLVAGGALIMTTAMSATNTVDSKSEMTAYYGAEAGLQATLNVLRGNVAPNPVFVTDPYGGVADENKISFRRAVNLVTSNYAGDTSTTPRLSRWLSYSSDRVTLPISGLGFNTVLSDPDNTSVVTFSTLGAFGTGTPSASAQKTFGSGNAKVRVTFNQQATTTLNGGGSTTLGSFIIDNTGSNPYTIQSNENAFTLVIAQTAPWPVTVSIDCVLSGTISSSSGNLVITFPTTINNLQGTLFTRTSNSFTLPSGTTTIPVIVTAPEPTRLIAQVTGFGPRSAKKQMQMILSRFAFDFSPVSMITIRSADDGSVLSFNAGNSSQYLYNGNDNSGGQNLPAFAVTSLPDYTYVTSQSLPAGQVKGSPSGVQQVSVSSLPWWLQTADGARAIVDQLRIQAQNNNRYFTAAYPPSSFGTDAQPLLTFVDGDSDLPPAGGAGLLIVTGNFTPRGSAAFKGLILVLGTGVFDRSGGGNGDGLGSVVVARFNSSGNFLAPTFNSSGSGTSSVQYDSIWAAKALGAVGPRVLGVSEY